MTVAFELPDLSGLGRLDGRRVVVTGGSAGIGLHTAAGLAALGADVLVTGRDAARGTHAVDRIRGAVPGAEAGFLQTDLSRLAGIREAAKRLADLVDRPHVLIHNAGVLLRAASLTEDGLDVTLVVNHLAPFLLNQLLWPTLTVTSDVTSRTRVLVITSGAARFNRFTPSEVLSVPTDPRLNGFRLYAASKAMAALTTLELADRTAPDPGAPRLHLVDPGGANTSLVQGMGDQMNPLSRALFRLVGPSRRAPVTAARSSLLGAAGEATGLSSGGWISPRGQVGKPPRQFDRTGQRRDAHDLTVDLVQDAGRRRAAVQH